MIEPEPEIVEAELLDEDDPGPDEVAGNYAYTTFLKAPKRHRDVATYAILDIDNATIAKETGLKRRSVEKILEHPPIRDYVSAAREQVALTKIDVNRRWLDLLDKAVNVVERTLGSDDDAIALRAAQDYLDRRGGLYEKKRRLETFDDPNTLSSRAISEVKANAKYLPKKEQTDGEAAKAETTVQSSNGSEGKPDSGTSTA